LGDEAGCTLDQGIIGVSRHAAILAAPEPMKIHETAH
jgi:hypothetical protein